MAFKPHYSEIKQSDKSQLFIVHYAEHSSINITHVFNCISDTYMGITVDGFTETLRGLLRMFPNFLEVIGYNPRKELAELGFIETKPTKLEKLLYEK